MLQKILIVSHVLLAGSTILLILIQHGKGAQAGAAFGAGASGTVFGARGSSSFLSRTTAILATLFFATSLSLAYFAGNQRSRPVESIMDIPEQIEGAGIEATGQPPETDDMPSLPLPEDVLPAAEPPEADLPTLPAEEGPQQ